MKFYAVLDMCEWNDLLNGKCAEEVRIFNTQTEAEHEARAIVTNLCDYSEDGNAVVAEIDVANAMKFVMGVSTLPIPINA